MPSLTRDTLAANGFRTLGLPATATQAAVDAAARRMRIWPDPSRVPPTAWDVPWLGPIARARTDVENAVAKLTDPAQRVVERALWYHGQTPPADPVAAADLSGIDAAVGALHAAVVADPAAVDVGRWTDVLARWAAAAGDPAPLVRAEADGAFEKRASETEVRSAVAAVPAALADAMAARARAALDAGDAPRCHALVAAVQAAGHARSVADLLDRLEDAVWARCEQIDHDLRAVLRTNHNNPAPFHLKNRQATYTAVTAYNATVNPSLNTFCDLVGDGDPYRLTRVRAKCGDLLLLIALGWEWSGNFPTARGTLALAEGLAAGTPLAVRVAEAIARVDAQVDRGRAFRQSGRPAVANGNGAATSTGYGSRPAPSAGRGWRSRFVPTSGGGRVGWTAVVVVISVVIRAVVVSGPNLQQPVRDPPAIPDADWISRSNGQASRSAGQPAWRQLPPPPTFPFANRLPGPPVLSRPPVMPRSRLIPRGPPMPAPRGRAEVPLHVDPLDRSIGEVNRDS